MDRKQFFIKAFTPLLIPRLSGEKEKSSSHKNILKPIKTNTMDKFKKLDKEFRLTDSSVNCYGFRLLTSGYQLADYQRNPIGYYMHDRALGIIVKWDDLRIDGDAVFGKPVINMSHPRALQTVDEIENGFLNAASVGHIVAIEFSDAPELKVPGQDGVTVTKWFNRECSLVDIPGNMNALALFDKNENPLKLSDLKGNSKVIEHKNSLYGNGEENDVVITVPLLHSLNLPLDTKDISIVRKALANLANNNGEADDLVITLPLLHSLNLPLDTKDISIVRKALAISGTKRKDVLNAMSWDKLHENNLLSEFKELSFDMFKTKFKQKFKKDYV
jgi:hypothetical protein